MATVQSPVSHYWSRCWKKDRKPIPNLSNNISFDEASNCCDGFSDRTQLGSGQFGTGFETGYGTGSGKSFLGSWKGRKVVVKKIPKKSFGVSDVWIVIRQFLTLLQVIQFSFM